MITKKADLHSHSIYSDGSDSPEQIVRRAEKNNIGVIALTDHDNIDGSKEIVKIKSKSVYIYSGVELTAKATKGRQHILGINVDLENPELNSTLKEMRDNSIYNMLLYIDLLKKDHGIFIPQFKIDQLLNLKGNIGRPQLALILIDLGYCKTVEEAFNKYLIDVYEKVRSVKKGLTKEEAVSLIVNAGGVASLAHPNTLKMTKEELRKELLYLKSLGLSCIEAYHSNEPEEARAYYLELAKELDLMISGGTDYHGFEVKPDIELGSGRNNNTILEESQLTLIKNVKSRYM